MLLHPKHEANNCVIDVNGTICHSPQVTKYFFDNDILCFLTHGRDPGVNFGENDSDGRRAYFLSAPRPLAQGPGGGPGPWPRASRKGHT